jgi:hypothetical protein
MIAELFTKIEENNEQEEKTEEELEVRYQRSLRNITDKDNQILNLKHQINLLHQSS